MANIICIETSAKTCSVALSIDGEAVEVWEENETVNHARLLAPFVENALATLERRELPLDAVAVSVGPGSYTGLRIGLSMAKGLCFSRDVRLITVPTLRLQAVKGMFSSMELDGTEYLVPMIDARRMEVYVSVFDFRLNEIVPSSSMILSEDSFSELLKDHKLCFIGDGAAKAKELIHSENAIWLSTSEPHASTMAIMAEKAFRENDFADVAYSVPVYLKEYNAKHSVNRVLAEARGNNP